MFHLLVRRVLIVLALVSTTYGLSSQPSPRPERAVEEERFLSFAISTKADGFLVGNGCVDFESIDITYSDGITFAWKAENTLSGQCLWSHMIEGSCPGICRLPARTRVYLR